MLSVQVLSPRSEHPVSRPPCGHVSSDDFTRRIGCSDVEGEDSLVEVLVEDLLEGSFKSRLGLADVPKLTESTRQAGVDVKVRWQGEQRALSAEIDACAFRILQEALTNVVRHARATSCFVAIDQDDDEISIEVTDDGQGGHPNGMG